VLSYRVTLDVPLPLVLFVSRLLAEHRREIGTRDGTRALTCWKQAIFALAWFRDRPDIRRLGQGPGISQATAYLRRPPAYHACAVAWGHVPAQPTRPFPRPVPRPSMMSRPHLRAGLRSTVAEVNFICHPVDAAHPALVPPGHWARRIWMHPEPPDVLRQTRDVV
jgi:hypothetical protein